MNIINIAILVAIFAIAQSYEFDGTITISSLCFGRKEFNYINADYGPKKSIMTARVVLAGNGEFCQIDSTTLELTKELPIGSKKALLVQRGNCTFGKKTRNAQAMGVDLIIVFEQKSAEGRGVLMKSDGETQNVRIPSILIGDYDSWHSVWDEIQKCKDSPLYMDSVSVITDEEVNETEIILPEVSFNISRSRGFAYLQDFYYHPYFSSFSSLTELRFILLYNSTGCSGQNCAERNCIFQKKENESEVRLCVNGNDVHSGRQVMLEQVRSYAVYKELGGQIWWKYVIVFVRNNCHLKSGVEGCAERTLRQLNISLLEIARLKDKVNKMVGSTMMQFLKSHDSIEVRKISRGPSQADVYNGLIKASYAHLCSKLASAPQFYCKRILNQTFVIQVNEFRRHEEVIVEPTKDKDGEVVQLVVLQLGEKLRQEIEELLILLTRCPGVSALGCEPYPFEKYFSRFGLMGFFGSWNGSSLTKGTAHIFPKSYGTDIVMIDLNGRELLDAKMLLQLKLGVAYRSYLQVIPRRKVGSIVQSAQQIIYVTDRPKVYQILMQGLQNRNVDYFMLMIKGRRGNVRLAFSRDADMVSSLLQVSVDKDSPYSQTFTYVFKPQELMRMKVCVEVMKRWSCRVYMRIEQVLQNELFSVMLKKYERKVISSFFYQDVMESFLPLRGAYDYQIRMIPMRGYGTNSFSVFRQEVIDLNAIATEIDVRFKVCSDNLSCLVGTYAQWQQLQNANRTRELVFEMIPKLNTTSHSVYHNLGEIANVREVGFNNPQNTLGCLINGSMINVYVIFRSKVSLVPFQPHLVIARSRDWQRQKMLLFDVRSFSKSAIFQFLYQDLMYPDRGFILLIEKHVDEHIRVYSRVVSEKFQQRFFRPIGKGNVTALDNIFWRYKELYSSLNNNFVVQVMIEDRLQRPISYEKPYYSIGWAYASSRTAVEIKDNQERFLYVYAKVRQTSPLFAFSKQTPNGLLYLSTELKAFREKLEVCDWKNNCYNYTHFNQRWRDFETDTVVKGLKVTSEIQKGFRVTITDYAIKGAENMTIDQVFYYTRMPVEVRLRTRVMKMLVEAGEGGEQEDEIGEEIKSKNESASPNIEDKSEEKKQDKAENKTIAVPNENKTVANTTQVQPVKQIDKSIEVNSTNGQLQLTNNNSMFKNQSQNVYQPTDQKNQVSKENFTQPISGETRSKPSEVEENVFGGSNNSSEGPKLDKVDSKSKQEVNYLNISQGANTSRNVPAEEKRQSPQKSVSANQNQKQRVQTTNKSVEKTPQHSKIQNLTKGEESKTHLKQQQRQAINQDKDKQDGQSQKEKENGDQDEEQKGISQKQSSSEEDEIVKEDEDVLEKEGEKQIQLEPLRETKSSSSPQSVKNKENQSESIFETFKLLIIIVFIVLLAAMGLIIMILFKILGVIKAKKELKQSDGTQLNMSEGVSAGNE